MICWKVKISRLYLMRYFIPYRPTACIASAKRIYRPHRDIAFGNVMVGSNGRGLLVDWDITLYGDEIESESKPRLQHWHRMVRLPTANLSRFFIWCI